MTQFVLEQVQDPEFWRELNPELTISEDWSQQSMASVESELGAIEPLLADLKQEGYFQRDAVFPASEVLKLRNCIETLRQAGWLPAFAYLYDEFWQLFARLAPILAAILGEDYLQVPDVWAWYVAPSKADAGWEPHRDRRINSLLPDGTPKAVNIWIPLTDVTPLNGCMYILPADLDPNYHQDTDTVGINPQDIRALPAPAGSVLCWNPVVWHWGSRSSDKTTVPRISVACDFQRSDSEPYEAVLLDPAKPIDFEQRLGLIAKLLLRFHKRYRYPEPLVELAVRLQQKAPLPYWIPGNRYLVLSDRWQHVGIAKETIVEISRIQDDGKVMVRHPEKQGIFYPFPALELEDAKFAVPGA